MVDTGPGISVISPKFFKTLNLNPIPWVVRDLLVASKQLIRLFGSVNLNLTMDNHKIRKF